MIKLNEGQPVKYFPVLGVDIYTVEITNSEPFDFHGEEVIKLKGKAGFFATSNIETISDE